MTCLRMQRGEKHFCKCCTIYILVDSIPTITHTPSHRTWLPAALAEFNRLRADTLFVLAYFHFEPTHSFVFVSFKALKHSS